ncbi:FISUMP domain-containing protein [Tunicatimonas pelagia]|uniref:FISUMP domain-containing protein n=1 Tax=Tunicatimonas pelagia TaxID=931531 RepID=UPI002666CC76|nr:FISUMP domain-containing protein [Tunicatimonas pelagia]WKN44500.1 FISUMP domain-containing protein [Tunicatimonas pelagia]
MTTGRIQREGRKNIPYSGQVFSVVLLLSVHLSVCGQHIFMDARDGNEYEIVEIASYRWFKENIRYQTPTSWCSENPHSEACQYGNYYYPTDLVNICPEGWRVPTWLEYRAAIKEIEHYYGLADSVKYVASQQNLYKDLLLDSEWIVNLSLMDDSTFLDMAATGWVEGNKWKPQEQTTVWIIHDVSNTPQPHVHVKHNEIIMHSHGHHVLDKPKNMRRFAVRCICDANQASRDGK